MKDCDLEYIHKKLTEIVENSDECPLCGYTIYAFGFTNRHLPFVEDHGDVVVGGIICGNRGGQKVTLIQCRRGQFASDTTRIYG